MAASEQACHNRAGMPLTSGTKLGPYEIQSPLGAGGMGEVYRARDTRLDRIVAIKVLPAHLADNAELRERFEREARTVASLNHPHICTLFDIGRQGDIEFLVLEYLEGEARCRWSRCCNTRSKLRTRWTRRIARGSRTAI